MYKIDSPVYFEVKLEPYCKGCGVSDHLSIDETILYIDNERHIMRTIRCSNHGLCRTLYGHIKNEIEKGEDDEIQD